VRLNVASHITLALWLGLGRVVSVLLLNIRFIELVNLLSLTDTELSLIPPSIPFVITDTAVLGLGHWITIGTFNIATDSMKPSSSLALLTPCLSFVFHAT